MITERSIKLLSSVMLISANRIKVLRLWLTCFEDWPIRILTFAWWRVKTRNTMVSWQVARAAGGIVWLKFWRRSRDPKKKEWGRGVSARGGSAANSHSTGTAAPLPNLPRLVHNTASYAGYVAGVSFPPSRFSRAQNSLSLPFQTHATQANLTNSLRFS